MAAMKTSESPNEAQLENLVDEFAPPAEIQGRS